MQKNPKIFISKLMYMYYIHIAKYYIENGKNEASIYGNSQNILNEYIKQVLVLPDRL